MAQSIADKIFAEYDQLRSKEALLKNKRVNEIHERFPELEEIRREIASAGIEHAVKMSKNPEDEAVIREALSDRLKELETRKRIILEENNIPEDYDRIRYHCELCRDTGFVDNEKCRCYKARLMKYSYERSNLSVYMKNATFDSFDFKYFSDTPEKDGISSLTRIKKAYNEARNMCESFESYEKSLLFFGGAGLGKTYLSGCIANSLIEKGYSVLYMTSGRLFELLENKKFNKLQNENDEENIAAAYDSDLLIIDDLGTEIPSRLTASFLYDIVNERIMAGKKMIISTNLSMDELSRDYTPRFVSRLFENFYAVKFVGKDIRKQKMYE
ncbi:MAG: ATP-binding protein [Clostridia bacterium]|nr:ATP-binding protein [Clostridia bacterium]